LDGLIQDLRDRLTLWRQGVDRMAQMVREHDAAIEQAWQQLETADPSEAEALRRDLIALMDRTVEHERRALAWCLDQDEELIGTYYKHLAPHDHT